MSNIDRIVKLVVKDGGKNILIHTIPGTQNWILAQKIEDDRWFLTLCHPMKNATYNLGIVSDEHHLALWQELTMLEVEQKTNYIKTARQLRGTIRNFLQRNAC